MSPPLCWIILDSQYFCPDFLSTVWHKFSHSRKRGILHLACSVLAREGVCPLHGLVHRWEQLAVSFSRQSIVPHAHWEAYGRGSLPLHNLVSDSANPHCMSDPLPQAFVGSSRHRTALSLHPKTLSQVPYDEQGTPAILVWTKKKNESGSGAHIGSGPCQEQGGGKDKGCLFRVETRRVRPLLVGSTPPPPQAPKRTIAQGLLFCGMEGRPGTGRYA